MLWWTTNASENIPEYFRMHFLQDWSFRNAMLLNPIWKTKQHHYCQSAMLVIGLSGFFHFHLKINIENLIGCKFWSVSLVWKFFTHSSITVDAKGSNKLHFRSVWLDLGIRQKSQIHSLFLNSARMKFSLGNAQIFAWNFPTSGPKYLTKSI